MCDFDFYSYEEDYSSPSIQYQDNNIYDPDVDIINILDKDNQNEDRSSASSPPPEINPNDDSLVLSTSIPRTREFLQQNFGLPISSFRTKFIPGIIILRISDISTLRIEPKRHLKIPHILYHPSSTHSHTELDELFKILNNQ